MYALKVSKRRDGKTTGISLMAIKTEIWADRNERNLPWDSNRVLKHQDVLNLGTEFNLLLNLRTDGRGLLWR